MVAQKLSYRSRRRSCLWPVAATVRVMSKRTPTLLLKPRDYAVPDYAFGTTATINWTVPAGGDELSRRFAELQHRLVVAVATLPDPKAAASRRPREDPTDRTAIARMSRSWGWSRSYFYSASQGRTWFHVTALAAVTDLLFMQDPHH